MASATLVSEDIARGRSAFVALDHAGVHPQSVFWRYFPESSDWRFVVALPTVKQDGPRLLYEQIRRILSQHRVELPLWRIMLLSTDDPLAHWAQDRVRSAMSDVRSTGEIVDNTVVDDAYIYSRRRFPYSDGSHRTSTE